MLILQIIGSLLVLNASTLIDPEDPVVIIDPETQTATQVQSYSQTLLLDARQRKLTGKSGFGDHYRRAAWAAADETPTNISTSIAILQELIAEPETAFDVYDAYRILGQLHSRHVSWDIAANNYSQASLISEDDPTLVDAHPVVYVSIIQGLSSALKFQGNLIEAAQTQMTLRDHPSSRISRVDKRTSAYSSLRLWFAASNQVQYIEAWQHLATNYPERLAGNQGVYIQLEHARSLSEFDDDPITHLDDLWQRQSIREYDASILVALAVASTWDELTDIPLSTQFAYEVLIEGWDTVVEHESEWIAGFNGSQQSINSLDHHTKLLLSRAVEHSIALERYEEALPIAVSYVNRYGDEDFRAAIWLQMVESELE